MNRRNLILLAAVVLIVGGAIFFFAQWFSGKPQLTILLRCNGKVSGKVSFARILPNGETAKTESFDAPTVCQAGKIIVADYGREEKLKTILKTENSGQTEIISVYGEDIQSDQNGFYTVLKLSETSPFLIKDKI